jgi:D-alanine-D-alanine ligase
MGHKVSLFGLFDDVLPLIDCARELSPDLVFNLCESFQDCRELEPNLIAMIELLGIRYTGAGADSLSLCKDKAMTKKLLAYHKLPVPRFQTFERGDRVKIDAELRFPCIVKPLAMEASEGIAIGSKVATPAECAERVRYLLKKVTPGVIVEEFIDGRELYVGMLGNKNPEIFPPQELFIKSKEKGAPSFLTYKGKWDKVYRKRWRIDSAKAAYISPDVMAQISETASQIFRILRLRGYARIDLRLRDDGSIVFLEANPNPSIARSDDFAQGAAQLGIDYDELIDRIARLGLAA